MRLLKGTNIGPFTPHLSRGGLSHGRAFSIRA